MCLWCRMDRETPGRVLEQRGLTQIDLAPPRDPFEGRKAVSERRVSIGFPLFRLCFLHICKGNIKENPGNYKFICSVTALRPSKGPRGGARSI